MFRNRLLNTDSYKHSHFLQLPEGSTHLNSYIESRGGKYTDVVNFGLQAFIKEYLSTPITPEEVMEAKVLVEAHGEPFNLEGWLHILDKHNGYFPVEIQAAPEGMVIPARNAVCQIVNTDPSCAWVTSFLETALLRAVWYPSTVATVSRSIKSVILKWLEQTGDPGLVDFKLVDFGARGVSSDESAALGGLAHLINFKSSDTLVANLAAMKYYKATGPVGFSIPASEHSTITSWGKENEYKAFANMVKKFGGAGKYYACVSDSYDIYRACSIGWGEACRDLVLAAGGILVVRPDSGDPSQVVLKCVELLAEKFGFTVNNKGYKVLNNVRVIQGDGIDELEVNTICILLAGHGWSADNITFGMGGGLLQHINRDTNKWAMKCSAIKINGVWHDVFKDPITDKGKRSKKGIQVLLEKDGIFTTVSDQELRVFEEMHGVHNKVLRTVYHNGKLLIDEDFETIRSRANA